MSSARRSMISGERAQCEEKRRIDNRLRNKGRKLRENLATQTGNPDNEKNGGDREEQTCPEGEAASWSRF